MLEIALDLNVEYSYVIVYLISRSVLGGFNLLRTSYYCNRKVPVCYVYSVYNPYSYGELSIIVPILMARDTFWDNIFSFLSFVRLKFHLSIFLPNFEYVLSFSFQSQYFGAVKGYHNFCFEISKQRTNINLLFVSHQVRYNTCICISTL